MDRSQRLTLFRAAAARTRELLATSPGSRPLQSAATQLDYLIRLVTGQEGPERLAEINLGLLAVREIEGWDDELADMLHTCAAEARAMANEAATPAPARGAAVA